MRLDKFLVDCGIGSRTEVKKILKQKRVLVNGEVETSPKWQLNQETDQVSLDGQLLQHEVFVYYLLNKPKGVISATEDDKHRTVLDLLDQKARQKGVFPVGRLDKDTHGLLLLTNNGDLAHAMLSPKKHVDKCYQARVEGILTTDDQLAFEKGIELKDFTCQPAQLEILKTNHTGNTCLVRITIREGKFHQIKRMVRACGKEVVDLQRLSLGSLTLDKGLELGQWRHLTEQEIKELENLMQ
ncbi:pseudouridine synthase [Streptococcus cameli]